MHVSLRDITMDNFRECLKLEVADDQKGFVASNMFSLAEAKADGVSNPYAIYAGDTMVGFVMYDFEPKENRGYISRLMVDKRFQGRGYGRAAMESVIGRLKAISECTEIQTSYEPSNNVAAKLYANLGFKSTDEFIDGEAIVRIHLPENHEGSQRR
jgi:diamine N-acetyltransferase